VFEGERGLTRDCNKLGEFNLEGIPPMPRGKPEITVEFDIDANGILKVTATEKSTQKTHNITVTDNKQRLSKEEVQKMVDDAAKYAEQDKLETERITSKNEYDSLLHQANQTISESESVPEIAPEKIEALK
jgi:L1 cell adhesion molecule like protein